MQVKLLEWQTQMICAFIGAQAQINVQETGGRNPLVDSARQLHVWPRAEDMQQDSEPDPRGEQTGYVSSNEEGMKMMARGGASAPVLDTIEINDEQEVVGSELGAADDGDAEALGAAAQPGSYEAFQMMFLHAQPANTAPQPESA